jgi:hypothetical protein
VAVGRGARSGGGQKGKALRNGCGKDLGGGGVEALKGNQGIVERAGTLTDGWKLLLLLLRKGGGRSRDTSSGLSSLRAF